MRHPRRRPAHHDRGVDRPHHATTRHPRRPDRPGRPGHGDGGGDSGAVTVEVAGYTTLMLLTLLVGVQVVMWGMAALGAHYAANHATQTTRVYGGTAAAGQADANTILASAVGNALGDPRVTVTRTATTATVTIHGTGISIIPGFRPPVTVTVQAPVERVN